MNGNPHPSQRGLRVAVSPEEHQALRRLVDGASAHVVDALSVAEVATFQQFAAVTRRLADRLGWATVADMLIGLEHDIAHGRVVPAAGAEPVGSAALATAVERHPATPRAHARHAPAEPGTASAGTPLMLVRQRARSDSNGPPATTPERP